jgi:hypothetical protein
VALENPNIRLAEGNSPAWSAVVLLGYVSPTVD